jgi:SPP1 family predicted phage head-tail adaptor
MIDPGKLKTRLQIQAPVETDDGQGGVVRSYTTLTTAWAEVTPLSSRGAAANFEADASGASVKYRIVLRSNFILNLQHRLVDGARIFRISAIRDAGGRRFIAVDAELRVE